MARKRGGIVLESTERLQSIVDRTKSDAARSRALMLLAVKKDPKVTYKALAERLECTPRTICRWWSEYQSDGLERFIGDATGDVPTNTMTINYQVVPADHARHQDVSLRFLKFLNALPTSFDTTEWVTAFRDCLGGVLDGVDRIAVAVDLASGILDPGSDDIGVMVTRHHHDGSGRRDSQVTSHTVTSTPGQVFISQMIDAGFPAKDYHQPHCFDYHANGTEYLGTIVLWRNRSSAPIPQATLSFLRSLEPFMVFLFTDCIARRIHDDAQMRLFPEIVRSVATRIGLAPREMEIFMLQLVGLERAEIARRMGIVTRTVHNVVGRIHRKAGTRSYVELFARSLAPLGDD